MRSTLAAITRLSVQAIVVYPNADAGGRKMIAVIEEFAGKYPCIQVHKNLPHEDYLGLLKIASVLVGNSSSGIIESPSFHIPVVNVCTRQEGRERAGNTIESGYSQQEIADAIARSIGDADFLDKVRKCVNPYGKGDSADRIVELLQTLDLKIVGLQKKNFY
jgi:UDP-N-acetylglucosamine 2-epimerase (non-hydrolysing)/GDP/UDP-N,N'-diacetylbacillosamine 2-epimerase (hydrolysing)